MNDQHTHALLESPRSPEELAAERLASARDDERTECGLTRGELRAIVAEVIG